MRPAEDSSAVTLGANVGDELAAGERGDHTLVGKSGNDTIFGGAPGGRASGQGWNDPIIGGHGQDVHHGNGGHDKVGGGNGDDLIMRGPDNVPGSGQEQSWTGGPATS